MVNKSTTSSVLGFMFQTLKPKAFAASVFSLVSSINNVSSAIISSSFKICLKQEASGFLR